jgi:hypothetical protein
MTFIMLTVSFMLGTLLASVLATVIVLNSHVMKWYMKKLSKNMEDFEDFYGFNMMDEL